MKKYKEWLTNVIEIMESETSENYPHEQMVEREVVLDLINQLDEPEVLSQELPVIPKYVAEYLNYSKSDTTLMRVLELANTRNEWEKWEREYDWIEENHELFARAWLDGFTIANKDEELWKPIENYEGLYEVSNKGNVRSLDRDVQYKKTDFTMKITGVDLKPNVLKKGYLQVVLSKNGKRKYMLVHRLVMNAFNPTTDENLQINHIDGNKENNEVSNLEWVTAIENTNHAYDIGLRDDTIGNNRKLTEDEVLEIIDLYETGNYTQKELGNKYDVGRNTIGEILLGKTWGWLTGITREVAEGQKYYAKLKEVHPPEEEWLTNLSSPKYYALDTKGLMLGEFLLDLVGMKTEASTYTLKDWERYGINDSNADFVEVEGMNAIKPDHYRLEDLDKAIYNLQRLREYEEVEKHES